MDKIYIFSKRLSKYNPFNLQYPTLSCFNINLFHKVKLFFTKHNKP